MTRLRMFRVERARESCAWRRWFHMSLDVSRPHAPRRQRSTWPRTSVPPWPRNPTAKPYPLGIARDASDKVRWSKRTPGGGPSPSLPPTTAASHRRGQSTCRSSSVDSPLGTDSGRAEAHRDERRCGWRLTPARGFRRRDVHQGHASNDGRRGTPSDFANHGELVSRPPSVPKASRSTWVRNARCRIDEVLRSETSPGDPRPLSASRIARQHAVTSMPQPRCPDFPSETGTR